jgi:23S rRNA (pseudouridine1915-N3)-methyltransferase
MLLRLIAAGTKLPKWMNDGVDEYAARLKGSDYKLELVEISLGQRSGADSARAIVKEGERMLAALNAKSFVVALQVTGKPLSTEQLAKFLESRSHEGRDVAFCIGGPDGLAPEIDARSEMRWSLSALTLPHGLARVVTAEALYRAVSVIKNLPYHRA